MLDMLMSSGKVASHSNGFRHINKLCRARLVLGWLTIFRRAYHLSISVCKQPPRPTQPPTLCWMGNEYRPKCSDALWLRSKGWLIPFVDKRVCVIPR